MNNFYVYVYIDSITNIPFYIGKGKNNRRFDHLRIKKKSHLYNKIQKMISNGNPPNIMVLEQNLEELQAYALEVDLIALVGRLDLKTGPLLNLTKGGSGGAVSNEIVKRFHACPKYREKVKKRMLDKWSDIEAVSQQKIKIRNMWKDNSDRHLQNSEFMLNYWASLSLDEKDLRINKLKQFYSNPINKQSILNRHKKISDTLKVSSNFVKNNPKSLRVVTPYGIFDSKRQAAKAGQTTYWKFDQLLQKYPTEYYLQV